MYDKILFTFRVFFSERYLGNCYQDCFCIAYTHPLGGVDVLFGGYDLLPSFLPSVLRRLLTLINGGGYHQRSCST